MISRRFTRKTIVKVGMSLALLLGIGSSVAAAEVPAPSHHVSLAGQTFYEYEALLYQTFGPVVSLCEGPGCAPPRTQGWFYKGSVGSWQYGYTFTDFGPSTFHLMPSWFEVKGTDANMWSSIVTVNGRMVACNPKATEFLVTFGHTAGSAYLCVAPTAG